MKKICWQNINISGRNRYFEKKKEGGGGEIERKLTLMIVTPATIIHAHPLSVCDILSIMIVRLDSFLHPPYDSLLVERKKDSCGRSAFLAFVSFASSRSRWQTANFKLRCRPKYKGGIGQMIRYAALRLDKC